MSATSHACPVCNGTGQGGFRQDGGRLVCRGCMGTGQRALTRNAASKSTIDAWAQRLGATVIRASDLPPGVRGHDVTHVHLEELGERS